MIKNDWEIVDSHKEERLILPAYDTTLILRLGVLTNCKLLIDSLVAKQ